jgi:CheY-like chemotaxis protein
MTQVPPPPPEPTRDLLDVLAAYVQARRSGVLSIREIGPTATLTLSAGRIVRIRRFPATDTLGALLVRAGVLQHSELHGPVGETLEQLIGRVSQRRGVLHLLVRADDAIAAEMEQSLLQILARGRGSATFRPDVEVVPPRGKIDDDALTLPSGIDLEAVLAEARSRGIRFPLEEALLESGAPRPAPTIVVVDDDPVFLGIIAGVLGRASVASSLLSSTRQAVAKVATLGPDDLMLVDLFMPRSSGRGYLGGLEVLRAASERGFADRVFLAFESSHPDADAEAARLGAAATLRRPQGDDPVALLAFLRPLMARVAPSEDDRAAGFDLVHVLQAELGDTDWRKPGERSETQNRDAESDRESEERARELAEMKALLGELNAPVFDEQIPLLILRFASAAFVRGALFRVDAERAEFVGLGAFGVDGDDPGRRVRGIRIPLSSSCLLADAIEARTGLRTTWTDRHADDLLAQKLGARAGEDAFVAPLFSPRGIEGVLLADNAGLPRRFPNLALIEIFLQQAAAAMERAALARQVGELSARLALSSPFQPDQEDP